MRPEEQGEQYQDYGGKARRQRPELRELIQRQIRRRAEESVVDPARSHAADQHPYIGSKILEEAGFDPELRHAIMGHAPYTGVPRETLMARALFACDELCGFLTACALVQPSKSIVDVKPASVKKKLKDKAFARSVSRDDIYNGAQELGADLEEHITFIRQALLEIANEIGLGGTPA